MQNPRHRLTNFLQLAAGLFLWLAVAADCAVPLWAQRPQVLPIYAIQGKALVSPYYQQWLDTYGVVTGIVRDGFYLQDPVGDRDPATSDGIFVYTQKPPTVQPGQCIALTRAYVDEFYENTELSRLKTIRPSDQCQTTTIPPTAIPLTRLGTKPAALFEAYEGMVVEVTALRGIVQGPTEHFATGERELALLPAPLPTYVQGERVFQNDTPAMNALIYLTNELGATLPEAAWGTTVAAGAPRGEALVATAILDYNFGKYQLHLWPDTPIVSAASHRQPEAGTAATNDDFTLCTFNLLGLGQGSAQYPETRAYELQVGKRARTIAESLKGCTIIGLQETGTPQDAENLAALLYSAYQLDYATTALAGPGTQNREFPLTNSLLTRRDRVQVLDASLPQGCSRQNYDVLILGNDCPTGEYPLFDRPPLVVDLLVTGNWAEPLPLTVLVNHWKSKSGDEAINVVRRISQARYVATLVQTKRQAAPTTPVVVLGDLNDYYDSEAVETLRTAVSPPLLHLFDFLPPLDRYTYIYNGGSQALDHILATPNLASMLASVDSIHLNADFPAGAQTQLAQLQRSSDHDPVQIRLRPEGAAILGGSLTYSHINVQLRNKDGDLVDETTTDANGDFRFWNLRPGTYTLSFQPPPAVTIEPSQMPLTLSTGYVGVPTVAVTHHTVKLGIALALTTSTISHPE